MSQEQALWQPSKEHIKANVLTAFMRAATNRWQKQFTDYISIYEWSIAEPEQFWQSVWSFCQVFAQTRGVRIVVDKDKMPGAQWFPDAKLNFAENILRKRDDSDAIIFWGEDKVKRRLSWNELYNQVSRLSQALRALGVKPSDRVVGFMPNMPETVIAMLAATSIGAIWSSCSPDFGVQGVLDRFGQIEPKVFFGVDGYYYNGKVVDCIERISEIAKKLPTLQNVVIVPYVHSRASIKNTPNAVFLEDFISSFQPKEIAFGQFSFNHPLYIMYSSGTTGVPKCIVHGAGGTLLQHLKEHQLHSDIKPSDKLFYFTTCGWMMWNWLVSGLASQATLLLYDGSPTIKEGNILFDYAEAEGMTHFGTSAKFIDALHKMNLKPQATHQLTALRAIFSTGSPLAPESFDYVYQNIKQDVCLSSISGGTDILGCFGIGNAILPVWRGEIQCRALGMKVEVFNEEGKAVIQEKGELVCTQSFPSMPIYFWNDQEGKKYHAAYFEKYPNIWCHGDYVELTEHGGLIIYGRSDATLKPGGVRIGTAEIYRQVEQLDEIVESLVIGQEWDHDTRIVLFVRLRDSIKLDDQLTSKIKLQIRQNATPRHVPAKVVQVNDIPRTKSGKIVELAVREVVHGRPVKNKEALANPEALEFFRNREELQT